MATLNTIQPARTVKDQVYDALQQAILAGTIPSGEPITESQLADQLGVSRTPVREALHELEREGLVETHGVRGKRVRHITREEIVELFWLRQAIECAIVEHLAAKTPDAELYTTLEGLLQQQCTLLAQNDRETFLQVDDQFHSALVEATGFQKAFDVMANIKLITRLAVIHAVARPTRYPEVIAEHSNIIEALKQQDVNRARQAMIEHLTHTRDAALQSIPQGGRV